MTGPAIVGWDIGGVNVKGALVRSGRVLSATTHPFEVQRAPDQLSALLKRLAADLGAPEDAHHAITMTAELSQLFRAKRDGVSWVIGAVLGAFPSARVLVYAVGGAFLEPAVACARPLDVAASNWYATAAMIAQKWRDCVLVDVGTTTCDVIPIAGGGVAALGRNDPERLLSGELVYLGAVRTPVEAIVHEVPWRGGMAGVSAEGFALAGDVHVWRGDLDPADFAVPTPDGRPATREFARERLARVICADVEMVDDGVIDAIAEHVARVQVERVAAALARVRERHAAHAPGAVIAAGLGAFIALRAAARLGVPAVSLADTLGADAARAAPAAAVALLLERLG
ncbi:MAG TPA: hydantoinase/oxoprolinase family protein [Gemmatimonadaceae bacterium]